MNGQPDILFLRFEGPLQSWGETARWSVRDTRLEPTMSGVVGLLAACLGWGLDEDRRIAALAQSVRLGVRADRPGQVIRDYHTVVGGVMSAEGKIKINASSRLPETVESWRDYLGDACFLVGIAAEPSIIDQLEAAVRDPVWPPFLGRKSCVPAYPLYPALPGVPSRWSGTSLGDALRRFPSIGRSAPGARVRVVIDAAAAEGHARLPVQRRRDVPISFATRRFGYRDVHEYEVEPRVDSEG